MTTDYLTADAVALAEKAARAAAAHLKDALADKLGLAPVLIIEQVLEAVVARAISDTVRVVEVEAPGVVIVDERSPLQG